MQTDSKFRNLFLIRIGIGVVLFVSILLYCINGMINSDTTPKEALIVAFVALLFLVYVSIDLLNVFSLKIMEKGIEINLLLLNKKHFILYSTILSVDRQKTRTRDTRGINLTDGFHFSVLKYDTNKRLIISSDYFENYTEIVRAIKNNIE